MNRPYLVGPTIVVILRSTHIQTLRDSLNFLVPNFSTMVVLQNYGLYTWNGNGFKVPWLPLQGNAAQTVRKQERWSSG